MSSRSDRENERVRLLHDSHGRGERLPGLLRPVERSEIEIADVAGKNLDALNTEIAAPRARCSLGISAVGCLLRGTVCRQANGEMLVVRELEQVAVQRVGEVLESAHRAVTALRAAIADRRRRPSRRVLVKVLTLNDCRNGIDVRGVIGLRARAAVAHESGREHSDQRVAHRCE